MVKNNVLTKIRNLWSMLESNHAMLLTHNSVQPSCDLLQINPEAVVVKIYNNVYTIDKYVKVIEL